MPTRADWLTGEELTRLAHAAAAFEARDPTVAFRAAGRSRVPVLTYTSFVSNVAATSLLFLAHGNIVRGNAVQSLQYVGAASTISIMWTPGAGVHEPRVQQPRTFPTAAGGPVRAA